jgi:uncharacterized RDD family membrane protein YckC
VKQKVTKSGSRDVPKKPSAAAVDATPVQVVAQGMSYWFLVTAIGFALLCFSSLYFGLFVVASTFGSILLVSITLYAFFKYWPEDELLKPVTRVSPTPKEPKYRRAMVQVVQVDGLPKARFAMALRNVSRRQDSFKISKQGAERFAKTIRYLLQNS